MHKNNCSRCYLKKNNFYYISCVILFSLILFINIWLSVLVLIFILIININRQEKNQDFKINLPYLILHGEKIIYINNLALELFKFEINKNIKEYIIDFNINCERQRIVLNNKFYYACYDQIKSKNKILYLIQVDHEIKIKSGIIIGLIMIDNLDEAVKNLEEIKMPLLSTVINKKLNAFAQNFEGIIKKFEHDKYIFIFSLDKLDFFKQKKICILDQVREINIGNNIPVSLSIGIGANGENLTQTMNYARAALDLAQSRGGDQVVIKNSNEFYFFSDTQKENNFNTKVRARVKTYVMTELILESSGVITMGHKNTDADSLGACIGIYKFASTLGKSCKIILSDINESIKNIYQEINLNLEYSNVFLNHDSGLKILDNKTLVIILDTHRPSLVESKEILENASRIIVCDHHRKSIEFIKNTLMDYCDSYASSTCELITEMLEIKNIKLSQTEADALLAGISVDTKNFSFKTGVRTYEAASYLKRKGADSTRVKLFFREDLKDYKSKLAAINNMQIYNKNIGITICEKNTSLLSAARIADELLNIKNISASFVLCEHRDKIFISARSTGAINVQIISEKLGGGGHFTSAGAQLEKISIQEALELLKNAIN